MTGSDRGYMSWTVHCLSWQDTELHSWTKLTSDNMKRCTFTEGDKDNHPHNSQVECHLKLKVAKWTARHLHIMALEHNTIEVVRNRLFQVPWHVLRSMTPCNKLTMQKHPQQQNSFIQMSEVATQFGVQVSTPSNRLMWQHVCRSAHPAIDSCGSMCAGQHVQQWTQLMCKSACPATHFISTNIQKIFCSFSCGMLNMKLVTNCSVWL